MIRLVWVAAQPISDAAIDRLPDQREYLSLGRNLLHERTLYFVDPRFDQPVHAYRTPGYPAFIAMMGGNIEAIRLAQALIDCSTILAIYLLAKRLSDSSALPPIAGLIVAVNPFLIYFSGLILSETLLTALLAWGILLLVRHRIFWAGVVFLAAVMVRPSALLLGPLLAGFAVGGNPRGAGGYWMRGIRDAGIVAIILAAGMSLWAMRNHRVLGTWIWTTTNSGVTLYDGFNPNATGASDQRFIADLPQLRSMNEVERSRYLQALARQWALQHPLRSAVLTVRKILRTWSPIPLSDEYSRPLYRLIAAAYALPLDLLVLLGIISRRIDPPSRLLLLTPAIYFTVIHALSVGSLRYRIPAEPPLAALAACGLISLQPRMSRKT